LALDLEEEYPGQDFPVKYGWNLTEAEYGSGRLLVGETPPTTGTLCAIWAAFIHLFYNITFLIYDKSHNSIGQKLRIDYLIMRTQNELRSTVENVFYDDLKRMHDRIKPYRK
jgi:hypothetical protein